VDGWITDKLPSWAGGTKWATQQQVMAAQTMAQDVLSRALGLKNDIEKLKEPAKGQHSGHYSSVVNAVERDARTTRDATAPDKKLTEAIAIQYAKLMGADLMQLETITNLIGRDMSDASGQASNQAVAQIHQQSLARLSESEKELRKYEDPWGWTIDLLKKAGSDVGGVAGSWSWSAFKPLAPWLAVGGVVVGVWLFGPAIKAALAARQARKSLGVGPLPPFGGIR